MQAIYSPAARQFFSESSSQCFLSSLWSVQKIILFYSIDFCSIHFHALCCRAWMSSVVQWSITAAFFFFSLHLGICSGMNVCSYACFIFMLENRRVKETCLMLELELICLWNKLPQETKFIKQTLCRSFVSCRLKKVVGKNITPAANLLGMPGSWGCVCVCVSGTGVEKPYWQSILQEKGKRNQLNRDVICRRISTLLLNQLQFFWSPKEFSYI